MFLATLSLINVAWKCCQDFRWGKNGELHGNPSFINCGIHPFSFRHVEGEVLPYINLGGYEQDKEEGVSTGRTKLNLVWGVASRGRSVVLRLTF